MTYCILVIDPDDGEEMYVRQGIVPGEGPVIQFAALVQYYFHLFLILLHGV